MPVGVNPLVDWNKFNYLVLGGVGGIQNPGIFKLLDGGGRPYKWMINDPPGMQGAYVYYRGWRLSDGMKLQFVFWEASQIDEYYRDYDPLLSYDGRKIHQPKPIIAYHPVLAYSEINAIFIKEKGPLKDLGGQLWSVTHDACEYRKPPKLNVTTEPDEPQTRTPTIEDRIDARTVELARRAGIPIPELGIGLDLPTGGGGSNTPIPLPP